MLTTEKILEAVQIKGRVKTSDFISHFGVSRQYVSKLLSRLVEEKRLIKIGSTRSAFYITEEYLQKNPKIAPTIYSKIFINKNLEEHNIFRVVEQNFLPFSGLSENIKSIFEYAFSEILNNAIEHSNSKKIRISVSLNNNILVFIIDDFGIGIFRNIMKKRNLKSETEAIQDLLKGKTTTAPNLHSGEGIFFTSKISDEFIIDSYGHQLIADNLVKDIFFKKIKGQKAGTKVIFRMNVNNTHNLNDIFKKYTSREKGGNHGFDKTEIRVKLYVIDGVPISRSQARRVLTGLEKFKIIVFDFDKVETVGQAFADEVFRVFHKKYPTIKLMAEHMAEGVRFMVERVKNEAKILKK